MSKASLLGFGLVLLWGCGGDTGNTNTNEPPAPVAATLSALTLSLELPSFEVSQTQGIQLEGLYSDGTKVSLLDKAELSIEGEAATLDRSNGIRIVAVKVGTAVLKASFEGQTAESTLTVEPAHLVSLEIAGEDLVGAGETITFVATGHYADESTQDVTASATWSVSDAALGTFTAPGQLKTLKAGALTVTATFETTEASKALGVECRYPSAPSVMLEYEVLPNMSWEAAYIGDGTKVDFSTRALYCDAQYADKTSVVLLVMAGWCPHCPEYLARIVGMAPELEAAGAQLVFLEAETETAAPATSYYAQRKVNTMGGGGYGIRLGDADNRPVPDTIRNSPIINAFPSVYVFRKRDMKMIATQAASDLYLPLVEIAQNPEWNWQDPQNPTPSFRSNCAEGQDEASEPNDSLASAAVLSSPLVVDGGICTDAADFYSIDVPGAWRVTLQFQNAVGDLDLDLWNPATGRPVVANGRSVGSFSSRNTEAYQGNGPAVVRVYGVTGASAPYRMFFEVL